MIRRPPRSTLFSLHDALPISAFLTTDRWTEKHLPNSPTEVSISTWGSRFGASYTLIDRKSTRLNSSHANISYAVFCLKKKKEKKHKTIYNRRKLVIHLHEVID